jgi:hypothetical protein
MTPQASRQPTIRGMILTALALSLLAGCASDRPAQLEEANRAYQRGDFTTAQRNARPLADDAVKANPAGKLKGSPAEAAYVTGISAYRARDYVTAERYLSLASSGSDSKLVGDASVELGLLYSEQARHDLAAKAFVRASENLTGQDRANACYYAGISQQKLGQWQSAYTMFSRAMSYAELDEGFRQRVATQARYNAFTVQLGAFENQPYATNEAVRYADRAKQMQLGLPRVMLASYQSKPLYLVWVGNFTNYAGAAAAKTRLGAERGMVVFYTAK